MDVICPLDSQFADQIAALLAPPPPEAVQDYYVKLLAERQLAGVRVEQNGEHGKGVYANMEFKEGELIFKDQMLVGAQHSSNKFDCLVCSHCFCYIGSIELQIGRKLYFQGLRVSTSGTHGHNASSDGSSGTCSVEVSDEEDHVQDSLGSVHPSNDMHLPKELIESLMNGCLTLPYSKQFSLPSVIQCPGGCEEEHYCSKRCAEADWEMFHSILCTGEGSKSHHREALVKFINHAIGTNDIFVLAAKVISFTILKYKKLKSLPLESWKESTSLNKTDSAAFPYLLEAWKPVSMGFKGRWWDCIALPDDIDSLEEGPFRMQIRDLAYTSLQLLKEAIFDDECAPLFSLEIFGHIIGMFELNNLDLVVASPVEDYFICIDDLPQHEKEEAKKITRPFLNALGDDYSVCCQGSAFFPLQSCINHSCHPNARAFKRDEDRDGQAVIIVMRSIAKGEEITISYIDEDLPYDERQASLADYGFQCRCIKCFGEKA